MNIPEELKAAEHRFKSAHHELLSYVKKIDIKVATGTTPIFPDGALVRVAANWEKRLALLAQLRRLASVENLPPTPQKWDSLEEVPEDVLIVFDKDGDALEWAGEGWRWREEGPGGPIRPARALSSWGPFTEVQLER